MSLSVAFVREMKVGSRTITNADLRGVFAQAGFRVATAFRSSGNVIFVENGKEEERAARLQIAQEAILGSAVPLFLRSATEVRNIAAQKPFSSEQVGAAKGKLQVLLLAAAPSEEAAAAVLELATPSDALAWVGRELYWLPSEPAAQSALDLAAIEALVGEGATRTMGTMQGIVRKLD